MNFASAQASIVRSIRQRDLLSIAVCLAAGFLPYLYLPLAASRHPALDDCSLGDRARRRIDIRLVKWGFNR